jgi:hypothetical protein
MFAITTAMAVQGPKRWVVEGVTVAAFRGVVSRVHQEHLGRLREWNTERSMVPSIRI